MDFCKLMGGICAFVFVLPGCFPSLQWTPSCWPHWRCCPRCHSEVCELRSLQPKLPRYLDLEGKTIQTNEHAPGSDTHVHDILHTLTNAEHEVVEGLLVQVVEGDFHGQNKVCQVGEVLPALNQWQVLWLRNNSTGYKVKAVTIIIVSLWRSS